MKTSNKLLLGLFAFIVASMIIGTVVLKNEATKSIKIETKSQSDTISNDSTSVHININ